MFIFSKGPLRCSVCLELGHWACWLTSFSVEHIEHASFSLRSSKAQHVKDLVAIQFSREESSSLLGKEINIFAPDISGRMVKNGGKGPIVQQADINTPLYSPTLLFPLQGQVTHVKTPEAAWFSVCFMQSESSKLACVMNESSREASCSEWWPL